MEIFPIWIFSKIEQIRKNYLCILFKPNSGSFSVLLFRAGHILNEHWCAEVEELEAFNLENGLM